MDHTVAETRQNLLQRLLDERIPRLWCPPLTHYTSDGQLDTGRMTAHWTWMAQYVRAFLTPGSTSDGWEMMDVEIDELLDFTLDLAARLRVFVLIGVLKTDVPAMCAAIAQTMSRLRERTGLREPFEVLRQARVCGFTVCPPRGAELTQDDIQTGLATVLDMDLPLALYQLPQVTQNEMSPAVVVADLAQRYGNFMLFKDTSGHDRVALADGGRSGVFLVRGAEGDYARWLRELGGPYHGVLLSTANCFAPQLHEMISLLEAGESGHARAISDMITEVIEAVFALVDSLPCGNRFTNANKSIDHWMAYGQQALRVTPPRLHAGVHLSEDVISRVGDILQQADLLPTAGYL